MCWLQSVPPLTRLSHWSLCTSRDVRQSTPPRPQDSCQCQVTPVPGPLLPSPPSGRSLPGLRPSPLRRPWPNEGRLPEVATQSRPRPCLCGSTCPATAGSSAGPPGPGPFPALLDVSSLDQSCNKPTHPSDTSTRRGISYVKHPSSSETGPMRDSDHSEWGLRREPVSEGIVLSGGEGRRDFRVEKDWDSAVLPVPDPTVLDPGPTTPSLVLPVKCLLQYPRPLSSWGRSGGSLIRRLGPGGRRTASDARVVPEVRRPGGRSDPVVTETLSHVLLDGSFSGRTTRQVEGVVCGGGGVGPSLLHMVSRPENGDSGSQSLVSWTLDSVRRAVGHVRRRGRTAPGPRGSERPVKAGPTVGSHTQDLRSVPGVHG